MGKEHSFCLVRNKGKTLQSQIRELMVSAILDGDITYGEKIPSPRKLSIQLGVSRNTVIETYRQLSVDGYIEAKKRSGYYVVFNAIETLVPANNEAIDSIIGVDWSEKLPLAFDKQRNIVKPRDWRIFDYPFICGQLDEKLFPFNDWRECCRHTLVSGSVKNWSGDFLDYDVPELLEQIRKRILPRRGIRINQNEILITIGAQHALYMLGSLLIRDKTVGIENPGYPDARNIFSLKAKKVIPLELDNDGVIISEQLAECDYVFVTPSRQSPTMIAMSLERRKQLLEAASLYDFCIIEDDYDGGVNFTGSPIPTLHSLDKEDRVIYVGSLSKTLAPGLRLGYLVGSEELIYHARALRRLMLRHAPSNNEYAIALFLSRGHYDVLIKQLRETYHVRWTVLDKALTEYLPNVSRQFQSSGTSCWIKGDDKLDSRLLQRIAAKESVLIETGEVYFMQNPPPLNYFRLGISSIDAKDITAGVKKLAELIKSIT